MIQPISTDLSMKKTKQTRRRKIIVPQDQKLLEMFTTDIERIQMYINSSPFADKMDAKVIRDINEQAAGNLRFPAILGRTFQHIQILVRIAPRHFERGLCMHDEPRLGRHT